MGCCQKEDFKKPLFATVHLLCTKKEDMHTFKVKEKRSKRMGNCNKNYMGQRESCEQYDMSSCPEYALAMAYVPWQHFNHVYEPDRALQVGTIFPELNKPFYGRKGMRS